MILASPDRPVYLPTLPKTKIRPRLGRFCCNSQSVQRKRAGPHDAPTHRFRPALPCALVFSCGAYTLALGPPLCPTPTPVPPARPSPAAHHHHYHTPPLPFSAKSPKNLNKGHVSTQPHRTQSHLFPPQRPCLIFRFDRPSVILTFCQRMHMAKKPTYIDFFSPLFAHVHVYPSNGPMLNTFHVGHVQTLTRPSPFFLP